MVTFIVRIYESFRYS